MKLLFPMLATAALLSTPGFAQGSQCRDAHGKFAKCTAKAAPAAAGAVKAKCKDGSSWSGAKRQGACSGHGGVTTWSK